MKDRFLNQKQVPTFFVFDEVDSSYRFGEQKGKIELYDSRLNSSILACLNRKLQVRCVSYFYEFDKPMHALG